VIPFFNLTLLHNTGAAFSFLSEAGGWQRWFFALVALIISAVILLWLKRLPRDKVWLAVALALVLGGALGNVWDRITLGYVIDFLDIYYQGWHWPAFNIADSAISVGAAMLIIDSLRGERRDNS
jgi:signal peptidase II